MKQFISSSEKAFSGKTPFSDLFYIALDNRLLEQFTKFLS